jgi:hypothetical protein
MRIESTYRHENFRSQTTLKQTSHFAMLFRRDPKGSVRLFAAQQPAL